jgi:hypothetical protein
MYNLETSPSLDKHDTKRRQKKPHTHTHTTRKSRMWLSELLNTDVSTLTKRIQGINSI